MSQRIKGQDVQLGLTSGTDLVKGFTAIKDFEVTLQTELKEEEYLGETSVRLDEIFKGAAFKFTAHVEDADALDFLQSIVDRAKRRTPGLVVNIKATLNFPNGTRRRGLLRDCFFGPMPLNFAGRGEYGAISIDGKSTDCKFI